MREAPNRSADADCVFIGYDRVRNVVNRRELTRKNMATLLGISYDEFCARFHWVNLHGEEVAPTARPGVDRELAQVLLRGKLGAYERAIFVGNAVAKAFGCDNRPFYKWAPLTDERSLLVSRTPHTSQRNWTAHSRWGQGRGPWAAEARDYMRALRDLS
jgi:hypothetical protein